MAAPHVGEPLETFDMAKSPFPGMDPYLERRWRDVHLSLIAFSRGQLNRQLRPPLRATAEERIYGQSDRERYLEIVDEEPNEKLVTVVEFFSPRHKQRGEAQATYLDNRNACRNKGINVVEIDLARSGSRDEVLTGLCLPPACQRAAYFACVRRAAQPQELAFYPIPLAARLPVIPIPLRQSDPEAQLDLQAVVELAYEEGHHDMLDYSRPLDPPLAAAEAEFAERVLKQAGKR